MVTVERVVDQITQPSSDQFGFDIALCCVGYIFAFAHGLERIALHLRVVGQDALNIANRNRASRKFPARRRSRYAVIVFYNARPS